MTTQYLLYIAPVTQNGVNLISGARVDAINDPGVTAIYLGLSTGGGGVTEGIAIHNLIRASPKPITVHALGNVDSIGITVMLGATSRYAVSSSRFFFHPLGFDTGANMRYTVESLAAKLAALTSDQNRLKAIYKARTKISDADLNELFERESMQDNAWATRQGFIEAEREFVMTVGARIRNL